MKITFKIFTLFILLALWLMPTGSVYAQGPDPGDGGQVIFGRGAGPSPYLSALVRERLALQCRIVRPDLLQRCSRAHVSRLDRTLAALVGTAAVDSALAAEPGRAEMVALRLVHDRWSTDVVALEQVRGERTVPEAIRRNPEPLRRLLLD